MAPERPAPAKAFHLAHIDGLRAICALIVFMNHAYAQVWNPGAGHFPPGRLGVLSYFLVTGHLSVTVFIVISGFVLALPATRSGDRLKRGIRDFYYRRARRILPPYYAAVALSLGLIFTIIGQPTGTLWDVPILANRYSIASHLLLLQDFFGTGSVNYVFWSIAVEWQIYFLFPLFLAGFRGPGAKLTVPLALLFGYALVVVFSETRIARANPHFIGMFALGMLAAYTARSERPEFVRFREAVPWTWIGAGALVLVALLVAHLGFMRARSLFPLLDAPVGVFASCLLVQTSRPEGSVFGRILAWGPLPFIGLFSYSFYLIHAPLLQVAWQYVGRPLGLGDETMFFALATAGLLAVLACAYAFHLAFERPFMGVATKVQEARAQSLPIS